MWVEQETRSHYEGIGGAVRAQVAPISGHDWEWKVGVLQNGRTEWTLIGATPTRQEAVDSAKAMISLMEFALESGGVVPCGW
jgi:hypothetical protein